MVQQRIDFWLSGFAKNEVTKLEDNDYLYPIITQRTVATLGMPRTKHYNKIFLRIQMLERNGMYSYLVWQHKNPVSTVLQPKVNVLPLHVCYFKVFISLLTVS